jgi:hypothetical protein
MWQKVNQPRNTPQRGRLVTTKALSTLIAALLIIIPPLALLTWPHEVLALVGILTAIVMVSVLMALGLSWLGRILDER